MMQTAKSSCGDAAPSRPPERAAIGIGGHVFVQGSLRAEYPGTTLFLGYSAPPARISSQGIASTSAVSLTRPRPR